ncbi:MAG: ABC transporter substrate-binding protein [Ilumatobacteraceae bacterium]
MSILDESDSLGLKYTTKRAAMDAMVKQINSNGGLGGSGHPVELTYCVTQFDPNLAQKCARDAAADPSILAIVGETTNYPDQVNPVLEGASMASIGTEPYGENDGLSPNSFPTAAGYISTVAGMGTVLADVGGAKKISVIHVDVPSALASVEIIKTALKARGLELVHSIAIPIGKADVAAETAAALDGSDGIALLTDPATANKVIESMTQQGKIVPIGGSGGQFSADALAGLGSAGNGVLLANWYASDDVKAPGVTEYLRVMEKFSSLKNSDDLAKSGYTAMLLLNDAAKAVPTIDRKSLLDALRSMKSFDTGGLTPTIDFTSSGPIVLAGKALPRFVNPTVMYGKVVDGAVHAVDGKFINPLAPK